MITTSLLGAGLLSACGGGDEDTEQGAGQSDNQESGQLLVEYEYSGADGQPVADSETYGVDGNNIDLPFGEDETILLSVDDVSDEGVTLTVHEQVKMDGEEQNAPTFVVSDGGTTLFDIEKADTEANYSVTFTAGQ